MAKGMLVGLVRFATTAALALMTTVTALQATAAMVAEAASNAPLPAFNPRRGYVATQVVAGPEALNIARFTPAAPQEIYPAELPREPGVVWISRKVGQAVEWTAMKVQTSVALD